MSPVSKIALLPENVRQELAADIRACAYGDIVSVTERLNASGYHIGKSAIGIFALRLKKADLRAKALRVPADELVEHLNLRLGCLQAAASTGHASTVLERAEEYLDWVLADA